LTTEIVGETDDKPAVTADEVLTEAKAFLAFCLEADGENHRNGLDDLKFLSGDQWDEADRRSRSIPGSERPCLTVNKLPTFLHQVTNDLRQNVPGIKVSPVDDGADVKVAEVLQGGVRHIEYASSASVAYDTAVGSAAAIGFGYFRLVTEYCDPASFDQEIRIKRIRNAFTVYFDPMSEEADGSDAKKALISTKMQKADFKRSYPQAQMVYDGFDTGAGDPSNSNWLWSDAVRVAEYYRIIEKPDTLIELSNGEVGFKSKLIEMPPGVTIVRERDTAIPTLEWYKLTALEVLEKTVIKCKWIPIFPVYGDEVDLDGKVVRSGLIRNAKDPQKMYNYMLTSATEEVGTRNKIPYIGADGQFEGYEDDWAQANTRNWPYLEYKPVNLDGQLAPAPSRQPMADIPNGLLTMALHANDNIKATTGLFDSSLGAKGNATSGVQERSQQRQGDIANFHYSDNLVRAINQCARCLIYMFPKYYDTQRVLKMMGEDGKLSHAVINQPIPPEQQQPDPETGAIQTVLNDMTVGDYDVTVSTGPSYSTMRQEAADSMVTMSKNWPKLMDVAGDKVIRAMDWPGADGMADRVKATIPPQILANDPEEKDREQQPMVQTPKGPIPLEQAAQMLGEMDQQIQAMGQALQEAKAGITKTQIETQSRENIAKYQVDAEQQREAARVTAERDRQAADGQIKLDIAELNGMVQLLVAKAKETDALRADAQAVTSQAEPPAPTAPEDTKKTLNDMLAAHPGKPSSVSSTVVGPNGTKYTVQSDQSKPGGDKA
jgi:hypothetical protein